MLNSGTTDTVLTNKLGILEQKIRPILSYIFSSCQGDNRPYLEVDILGIRMKGLLDTGANNTVIGNKGWSLLKNAGLKILPSSIKSCAVANDSECSVLGRVFVPFRLEEKVKVLPVLVIPDLPQYLILGMDFWLAMEIIPTFSKCCWSFSDSGPPVTSVNSIQSIDHLKPEQRQRLEEVVEENFSLMGDKLGCTTLVEHKIVTTSEPIKQRSYRVSPFIQEQIDKEVKYMLENDIIEPSHSAWSSPVIMVPKRDGSYRFCVDYRRLNRVTKKDAYPIPYIATILDKLRNAKYLSTIDIKSAYWQVPVAAESREYTAFTIPGRGLYHFKRMPMGLSNSPATWQRLADRLLGAELEPNAFVYLDDIIVVSDNFEKHIEVLGKIFSRMIAAGLTFSREKCKFGLSELKYLGYIVNANGLLVDPEKVKAILDIPPPKKVTEVRRILGVASWYRRFIPSFSTVIAPMTELLRKNKEFIWSDACDTSFQTIKNSLVSAPILSCPDFSKPFIVQTDASAYGIGAVLSQQHDTGEQVICYISRSLSRAERNYSTTERECLDVLFAVEKLRPFLEGYRFVVVMDHHSLVWLHNLKEPTGRLARWALRLQQFDFDIVHRKGQEHVVPDLLSRAVPEITTLKTDRDGKTSITSTDKWYNAMLDRVTRNPLQYSQWRILNGKLYKYVSCRYLNLREDYELWKEVVPKELRKSIIEKFHDSTISCHAGIYKTCERIKVLYFWPKMLCDIARYIRACPVCLAHKPIQNAPAGEMGQTCSASKPWHTISIDIVGPLPRSTQGYKFILSIVDTFSKYVLFIPLRSATASVVTDKIEEHVFLVYGVPNILICDNGAQFRSSIFGKLCNNYKVKILYTPLYHAQSNPVERYNRTLKTMLSCFVKENHKTWSKLLPKISCAIRTLVNETTGVTPFFINFGREHVMGGKDHDRPSFADNSQPRDYTSQAKEWELLYKDVKKSLDKAHQRSKIRYNLRHRPIQFSVGSKVYRKNYVISSAVDNFNAKLAPHYCGPFTVKRKIGSQTYQLVDENNRDKGIWHVKDLKAHPPED